MAAVAPDDPAIGRRVLVIDDSEFCRQFETMVLVQAGFEVRCASNADEFDQLFESWNPELILADLQMPDIDGATLCKSVRARYPNLRIPVILFSSLPESELADIALRAGADAYLSKQTGYDELAVRLRALCEEIVW
jgi:DNA-binding response OmpR family regulator